MLPVQPGFRLYPLPLATSAAYGLLIGLLFTLPPLARARTQPAAAIFRAHLAPRAPIDWRSTIAVGAAAVALVAPALRTEARRGGEECVSQCRSGLSVCHSK